MIRPIPLTSVRVRDDFWSPRQRLMTDKTIPYMEQILRDQVPGAEKSHVISNFRMAAGEEQGAFYGFVFQDSDLAKWLEAAAYSLSIKQDAELSRRVDEIVALVSRAQQPDGYLNTYFTVKEPQNRWTNLQDCHELYCAGHMMEAAAALHEAAGKDEMLRICVRLADHICDRFEAEEGIPGHEEIEIGLLRLYRATGNQRYRDMALRFLDLRGQDPEWFRKHKPNPDNGNFQQEIAIYNQSDVPVREQTVARGHAVRQVYLLTAMADAAAETGDAALREACERMFRDITERQMYVTGAVGANADRESFTVDFDLPGDRCYGETCASVAMTFFAREMLRGGADARYADLMELELYNGALAGMQLDGERFFYVNPLTVDLRVSGRVLGYRHVLPRRPRWHACACCPPNLARLVTSLGGYLWGEDGDTVYSHLFVGSEADTAHGHIALETGWPWAGDARYTVRDGGSFTLAVRIPGYVNDFTLTVNGTPCAYTVEQGYCRVTRAWRAGDTAELRFDLPVRRLHADPRVRDCAGKVALARGPFIYCVEGADQQAPVFSLALPADAEVATCGPVPGLPEEVIGLCAAGVSVPEPGALYAGEKPEPTPCTVTAIPYYAWANRAEGDMEVWIPELG